MANDLEKFGSFSAAAKIWHRVNAEFFNGSDSEQLEKRVRTFLYAVLPIDLVEHRAEEATEELQRTFVTFRWIALAFDRVSGSRETAETINNLVRIRTLCEELSQLTEVRDYYYLLGSEVINADRICEYTVPSAGPYDTPERFFGNLFTELCISSTTVYEGLVGVENTLKKTTGRPPVISKNWLIWRAADIYEAYGCEGGRATITKDAYSDRPDPYKGDFYDFALKFFRVFNPAWYAPDQHNSGLGSQIEKVLRARREDQDVALGLNLYQEPATLLRYLKTMATL